MSISWAIGQKKNDLVELFDFEENDVLCTNMNKLQAAVDGLNKGDWLNKKDELTDSLASHKITCLKNVGGLSFAGLCCFTGLCTSVDATTAAKLAMPNLINSEHSHCTLMKTWLKEELVVKNNMHLNIDEAMTAWKIKRMWKAIAQSLDEVPATIENATCAMFRGAKTHDIFFEGQHLCNLEPKGNAVRVKEWESNIWTDLDIDDYNPLQHTNSCSPPQWEPKEESDVRKMNLLCVVI